jgi:signal transduction histidine kinase
VDFPLVPLDERLLGWALSHLILNAREAMPRGGRLEVALALESARVLISLSDTGAGISHADLPYVFDPFFSSKPDGTGMGLVTVHRIIADHRGEIQISSAVGEGTEVKIRLPR